MMGKQPRSITETYSRHLLSHHPCYGEVGRSARKTRFGKGNDKAREQE